MFLHRRFASLLLIFAVVVLPLQAHVTRVEISSRVDVLNGKQFGEVGVYERIAGRIYLSLPVANPHNFHIVDLDKAVNLEDGKVEFSADFVAVRP